MRKLSKITGDDITIKTGLTCDYLLFQKELLRSKHVFRVFLVGRREMIEINLLRNRQNERSRIA